jgi:hypothetical protein
MDLLLNISGSADGGEGMHGEPAIAGIDPLEPR